MYENFIIKHWLSVHSEMEEAPDMRFKVLKSFQDPLTRMATESVLIDTVSNMNSKSEFQNNKLSRIVVEDPRKYKKEWESSTEEKEARELMMKIDKLRAERGLVPGVHGNEQKSVKPEKMKCGKKVKRSKRESNDNTEPSYKRRKTGHDDNERACLDKYLLQQERTGECQLLHEDERACPAKYSPRQEGIPPLNLTE